MLTEAGTSLKVGLKSNLRLTGVVFGVVAADTLELQHLSIAKWKTLGNMRPICEFEKLAFDSKIVWSHGHILRFEVVIDGVASSTKQQNIQKIDLDVVAFSKRAHIRYVSGKLARVARARRAVLVVVAFWFEFALACRAFVLRTIECSGRLVRT